MSVVGGRFGGKVHASALLANALAESEGFEVVIIATMSKDGDVAIGYTAGSMLRTIGLAHVAAAYVDKEMIPHD